MSVSVAAGPYAIWNTARSQPAHERMERLAGERTKDAMKVEGREVGQTCEVLKRQRIGQVGANVVDDPVDAVQVHVFGSAGLHNGAWGSDQSLPDTRATVERPAASRVAHRTLPLNEGLGTPTPPGRLERPRLIPRESGALGDVIGTQPRRFLPVSYFQ
jgi:hypothetical protein